MGVKVAGPLRPKALASLPAGVAYLYHEDVIAFYPEDHPVLQPMKYGMTILAPAYLEAERTRLDPGITVA
jgi:hypothetical protein